MTLNFKSKFQFSILVRFTFRITTKNIQGINSKIKFQSKINKLKFSFRNQSNAILNIKFS